MKVSQRVLNEVSDFIQFGVFLDKPSRKFLVSLIYQHLFEKDFDTIAELTQSEFHNLYPNWSNILLRLFQDPQLRTSTGISYSTCSYHQKNPRTRNPQSLLLSRKIRGASKWRTGKTSSLI